jgi:hypothetical protein
MGALAYLELRYALHRAQGILRSPLRLLVWGPYLFFVVYFAYARFAHNGGRSPTLAILPSYSTIIAGGYLAIFGATAALAACGRVAGFRSPAEAVLFSNARVRPLTIALWLQLRKLASSPMRWLGGFVYLFAVAAPKDTSPFAIFRALFVVALLVALTMGIELPAFLLGRGRGRVFLRPAGWGIAAIGALYALAGFAGDRFLVPLKEVTGIDPGETVRVLLLGDPRALFAIALLLAALAASVVICGDDALPELYAASLGTLAHRANRKRGRAVDYIKADPSRGARVPNGSLALVWKDWVAFRRGRGTVRLWVLGALAWTACGVAVGVANDRLGDASPIFTLVAGSAVLVLVLAPFNASVGLASDLSKPIFWLNAAPLRLCIASWTAGRSWRGGIVLGLAPTAAGIAVGNHMLALLSIPLALVGYWSLQSLGVALYAIFPDPIDARGPMLLVRLFVTLAYVAPAAVAYDLFSIFPGYDLAAISCAAGLLLLQGYGALELATYRLREYGASLATISRAT